MPDFPGFTRYDYAGTVDTDGSGGATGDGTLSNPSAPGPITNEDGTLNFPVDTTFDFDGATYVFQGADAAGFVAAGTGFDTGTYYFSTDAGLNGGSVSYQQAGSFGLCFTAGTRIATPAGERAVEELREGDLVLTRGLGGIRRIRWIGVQRFEGRFLGRAGAPVRIGAGALDHGLPRRDLVVSPAHAVVVDGHLVDARLLVDGAVVTQVPVHGVVAYWHLDLGTHDCVLAEGAWAESYRETGDRARFHNAATFAGGAPRQAPCLPHVAAADDPRLPALRARISARRRRA